MQSSAGNAIAASSRPRFDVAIVGGGPAGLSAAVILGRCLRSVALCDRGDYRSSQAKVVHGFLGHEGMDPAGLRRLARKEVERYATVELHSASVHSIEREGDRFRLVAGGEVLEARRVLIATGVEDELPSIAGMAELYGRLVHVCPYCDAFENRGAPIAVYGRGEKGARLALMLRHWSDDVILLCDGRPGLDELLSQQLERQKVPVRDERMVRLEATREGRSLAIHFEHGEALERGALFLATGQHVRSLLLQQLGCRFTEDGGAECDEHGATSVRGVYVAGDVSRRLELAVVATAEGARAAVAIDKALREADGP